MYNSRQRQSDEFKASGDYDIEKLESHLNLVLLALEAIANLDSEAIVRAAKDLDLELVVDRVIWRLRSHKPRFQTDEDGTKLDAEAARSLAVTISYLANRHQELLRRSVNLLEQAIRQNDPPQRITLLGNYRDRFISYYRKITPISDSSIESLSHLAWKLLIALLFYSGKNGHHLLFAAVKDI